MNRVLCVTAGVVIGGTVAAGLVLLLAPKGGAETRQQIQGYFQNVMAEGREAAEVRRLELTTHFESLKQPESAA